LALFFVHEKFIYYWIEGMRELASISHNKEITGFYHIDDNSFVYGTKYDTG